MKNWLFFVVSIVFALASIFWYSKLTNSEEIKNEEIKLLYMAPFLSGGGYSSESLTIALGLFEYQQNLHLNILQHGDSESMQFIQGQTQEYLGRIGQMFRSERFFPPQRGNWSKKITVICHSEPGAWDPPLYQTLECPPSDKSIPPQMMYPSTTKIFKIGRTMFETDGLPSGWISRCNSMNEIWVPTEFSKQIFIKEGVKQSKIKVIPEPIDTEIFDPSNTTPLLKQDGNTKFISIFKWETRKGWDILISAYLKEFKKSDNVVMYILTSKYHHVSKKSFHTIVQEYAKEHFQDLLNLPKIEILEKVSATDLPRLLKSMNCLVMPSRGEGWGRPHVEAMSMELPVIATNWSGNTEFMNDQNSFLLKYEKLVPILDGAFKDSGMKWAEPSVDHLRELMRFVHENPKESKKRGIQARKDMVEKYHPKIVSQIIMKELNRINKGEP